MPYTLLGWLRGWLSPSKLLITPNPLPYEEVRTLEQDKEREEMSHMATYSGSLLAWVSTCKAYRERSMPVMENIKLIDLMEGQHMVTMI